MDALEIERAVSQRRVWLDEQLDVAAAALGLSVAGQAVDTFDMRSAGAVARDQDGDVWLRVVVQDDDYERYAVVRVEEKHPCADARGGSGGGHPAGAPHGRLTWQQPVRVAPEFRTALVLA